MIQPHLITPELVQNLHRHVRAYCARAGVTDPDDVDDCIGVATEEVLLATANYDEDRATFLTFALRITEKLLSTFLAQNFGRQVPLAETRAELWRRVTGLRNALVQRLGRSPKPSEVADECGLSLAEYNKLRDECEVFYDVVADSVEDDREDAEPVPPLDSLTDDTLNPELLVENAEISKLLDYLPARVRYVISRLYGMDGYEEVTQAMLSEELRVSQPRIAQLARRGLIMLRGLVDGDAV